jgi:hypothetical protein
MFHLVSVWLTRFVVAAVLIALVVMYGPKWFAEQANQGGTPATLSSEKAAPVAPADKTAPAAPVEKVAPAAAASETAAPSSADQASTSFARCQPIGRTARGELVYSMDCRRTAE